MCVHNTSPPLIAYAESFSTQALTVSASVYVTVYCELGCLMSKTIYRNLMKFGLEAYAKSY
jgi:hypothetical protein